MDTGRRFCFDGLALSWVIKDPYVESLRRAGVGAVNLTVGIEDDFDQVLRNVDEVTERVTRDPRLLLATSADGILSARSSGRVAVVMGLQSATPVGGEDWRLRILYSLGIRIVQLTYNGANLYGSGCGEYGDGGLTFAGREFVETCNAMGILIDFSHCGWKTTADAVKHSKRPVVITHSNAFGKFPNHRNKPDDIIRLLGDSNGMVGAVACPWFIRAEREVTVEDYIDHIDYLVNLLGAEKVGVGFDFLEGYRKEGRAEKVGRSSLPWRHRRPDIFGSPEQDTFFSVPFPKGLQNHDDIPNLGSRLLARGYTSEQVDGILGGNLLRLFSEVVG